MKNKLLKTAFNITLVLSFYTLAYRTDAQNITFNKQIIPNATQGDVLFTKSDGNAVMVFYYPNNVKKIFEKTSSGISEVELSENPITSVQYISGPNNIKLIDIETNSSHKLFKYSESLGYTEIQTEVPYVSISSYGETSDRIFLLYQKVSNNALYAACYNGNTFTDFEISTEYNTNFNYFNFNPSLNIAYFKAYSFTSNKWGFFAANFQSESTSSISLPSTTVGFNSFIAFPNGNTLIEISNSTITSDLKLLENNQLKEVNDLHTDYDYGGISINSIAYVFGYKNNVQTQKIFIVQGQNMTDVTPVGTIMGIEFMTELSTTTSIVKMTKKDGSGNYIDELYKFTESSITLISNSMQNASQIRNFTLVKKVGSSALIRSNTDTDYFFYWVSEGSVIDVTSSNIIFYNQSDNFGQHNVVRVINYDGYGSNNHKYKLYHLAASQLVTDITPAGSWTGMNYLTSHNSIDYYSGSNLGGQKYLLSSSGSNFGIVTTTPGFVSYAFKKFNKMYFTYKTTDFSKLDKLVELQGNALIPVHTFEEEDYDHYQAGNEDFIIYNSPNTLLGIGSIKYTQSISGANTVTLTNNSYSLASYTATSGLVVSFSGSNSSLANVNNTTLTPLGRGVLTVTAFQSGNVDYAQATLVINVTINGAPQSISGISNSIQLTVGGANYSLATTTATSGLAVSFISTDNAIAKIENNQIVPMAAGVVTITVSQVGDAIYQPTSATFVVTVSPKASQTILNIPFNTVLTLSGNTISLANITATSGLAVTLESSDASIISIENGSLKTLATGVVTITAYQVGNSVYEASPKYTWVLSVVSPVLSSASTFENVAISIYPNPASDFIQISGAKEGSEYRFLTLDGKTVLYGSFLQESETRIDITQLQPGVYLFVYNNKDTHTNTLFVKE